MVQHLVATYGLLAVWVLMVAESACIPVPSEMTMLLAGALAAGAVSGPHPSLAAVVAAGTLGNVVGSYLAWLMGKYGGRPGLRRWGRYVGLRPQDLDKAQDWFDRRGASVVFWSRLLPGIRTFISLPAGIAEMPAARFGLYTAAGCLPWTAVLAIVGYGIGADWQTAERAMHRHSIAIAVVVFMAIGIWVLRAIRRSRRANSGEAVSSVNRPTSGTARDDVGKRWREIVCRRARVAARTPTITTPTSRAEGGVSHGSSAGWRTGVRIVGPGGVTVDSGSCEVSAAIVTAGAIPTGKPPLMQRNAPSARPHLRRGQVKKR
ncbi:DedA family protein [Mycobacterium seoulense]|uniref:DedA family protein n=1 Tax=Mycobacterium seoulense TaxID=386911 RepID=UPI003CE67A22